VPGIGERHTLGSSLLSVARGFGAAKDGLVSLWNRYEPPWQVELSPRQPSPVAHTQSALDTGLFCPSRSRLC